MLESVSFPNESAMAKNLCREEMLEECIILQTCHRIEIYGVLQDSSRAVAIGKVLRSWSSKVGVSYDILNKVFELYEGREALAHLFSLAAGLESMIVGEDQILGQVRTAYLKGRRTGSVGRVLDKTFMKAVNIGRRVRTETKINEGSVSISSAAVDLAGKEIGDFSKIRALVIGAGEAGSIAAEALVRSGTKEIVIANRTIEKGAKLAKRVSGSAISLEDIYPTLLSTDLAIIAVAVTKPLLKANRIKTILENQPHKKLLLIDVSQPRAVEEATAKLSGVVLKNIEDLKEIVEQNIQKRRIEAEHASCLVAEELDRFERELSWILVEPLISEIYRSLEDVRRKEFERALRKTAESDRRKIKVLERFSKELVERIMQIPTEQLKRATLNKDSELLSAARKLFKLADEEGK
jgi:glutamyl-tRNA reductase